MNVNIHSYIHGTFIPLRQLLLPTVFENNPKIAQTATIFRLTFKLHKLGERANLKFSVLTWVRSFLT